VFKLINKGKTLHKNNLEAIFKCDAISGTLNATNTSKHLIDQSEEKILQIDQLKNTPKHV